MKPAIFYALRQIRRRWRDDLPILLLCAAVMLSLLLLLMAMEGSWQARVLPDRAENYHFILYDLTPQEAAEIAARPNVQAVYYYTADSGLPHPPKTTLRAEASDASSELDVRVTLSASPRAKAVQKALMERYDLWQRAPYRLYRSQDEKNGFFHHRKGMNLSFCLDTAMPYILRPGTLLLMLLFALFLGAAVVTLMESRYRRAMPEYGVLRAMGFTARQIVLTHTARSVLLLCAALPVTLALSLPAGWLLLRATAGLYDGKAWAWSGIPLGETLLVFAMLTAVTAAGSALLARAHRRVPMLELLGGEESAAVSYVEKTSDALVLAKSLRVYGRLHFRRSRRAMALYVLAIAVMLPLPGHFFLALLTSLLQGVRNLYRASFIWSTAEFALLAVTAATVCGCAAYDAVLKRRRELAILRAMGCSAGALRRLVRPEMAALACFSALAAGISGNYIELQFVFAEISAPQSGTIPLPLDQLYAVIPNLCLYILFSLPLSALSIAVGASLALHRLTRGGILDGLRDAA